MKVLMISTDRKLFEDESTVCERTKKYGEHIDELHIIVFALKSLGLKKKKIAENITLYPTNSLTRFQYIHNALNIARDIKYDRITTQDPFLAGLVGIKLAKISNAALQIQVHTDFLSKGFVTKSVLNRFYKRIASHTLPKADCIRVVSEHIKESIEIEYKLKCTPEVLPIFVDIDAIKNTPKGEKEFSFQVLMASRLEPEKNVERAIKVFSKVAKENKNVGLIILGDGAEKRRLEKLARDYGVSNKVLFKGWVEDLVPHIKASDLFLQTSLFEGYGVSVVEALASGTPVLSTDVGIAREYGTDIFETDKELTEKVEGYIKNAGEGVLRSYPYKDEDEYVKKYVEMLEKCRS